MHNGAVKSMRRVVNAADVARHAGVAISTVSNVLNHPERVRDATLHRVQASIDALGFVRNDAARQVRLGSSQVLGMILVDSSLPFYWQLANAIEEAASGRGYSVLVANTNQSADRQRRNVHLFESQRTEGVLATPIGNSVEEFELLRRRGTPDVLIDYPIPVADLSVVRVDHFAGGEAAAAHLLGLGRRRLGVLRGPSGFPQIDERYRGAAAAVDAARTGAMEWIPVDSLGLEAGYHAAQLIAGLEPEIRPDAVFAPNDIAATGLIQRLVELGFDVPRDIAVVGYDDAVYPAAIGVSLTTVRQPTEDLGRAAIELLFEQLDDPDATPRTVDFVPQLVPRASTGSS